MWTEILLAVIRLCSGMLVSGGVFTVLIAVGLMPRFAGKTHTADKVFLYEEMVIWGTIIGGVLSIFSPRFGNLGLPGIIIIGVFGLFAGVFVGCLALAIAEMLDTIPIFARRIGFRHGLGIVVVAMAIGKMIGSALYFIYEFSQ
jgi:stage V sporulation protein AB